MKIPGYKIERLIAEGGMSSVYLAMQESLGRRVAIKVLKRFDSPQQAGRFMHEARIIASLEHRNIITIHDVGVIGDRYYIAMEYLEGGSLADRIDKGLQPLAALDLLESIARCLDFVHRKDIVHRDIKPSNILFHADGTAKLTDFGIAKQLDGDQEHTMDGAALGSPYYLSPEQAEGRPLDGRSDIYGLGIVLYQMLTGRKPYAESSHIETIVAHLSNPIPLLPDELSGYQGLLERMIAKRPENRVASADELIELIRSVRTSQFKLRDGHADGKRPVSQADGRVALNSGIVGRLRKSSSLTRVAAVAGLLVLAVGMIWLPEEQGPAQGAAPQVSRAPPVELNYDAGVVTFEQQAGAPPQGESRPEQAVPEITGETLQTDEFLVSEPVSDDTDDPDAEPAESVGVAEALAEATPPETLDPAPELIDDLMQAGDRALAENQLMTPATDNAYARYLRVIELDPGHQGALAGLDMIADRYAALARGALGNKDNSLARLYLRRGTKVQHDHADLLAIRRELDELDRVAASTQLSEETAAGSPEGSETRMVSWEFEGTSVTSQGPEGSGNIVKDFKNVWRSVFD